MPDIEELRNTLYQQMQEEQDRWRDWLMSLSANEILHHTCECTVREDILMAMEELELSGERVRALLRSPHPLADIYDDWKDRETDHMDIIRDTIEQRADAEIRQAQARAQRSEGR